MSKVSLPSRSLESEIIELRSCLVEKEAELAVLKAQLAYAREYQHRYEMMLARSNEIIFFIDPGDGRILEANAAATRIYGYSHEELLSMSIFDLRLPDEHPLTSRQLTMADEQGIVFETVHRRKDGSLITVEISSEGASISGKRMLISAIRDMSHRKSTENVIRENEERFRILIEQSPLGISLIDHHGRYQYVNPRFEEIFGYNLQDIPTGREWLRKAFPNSRRRHQVIDAWLQYQHAEDTSAMKPKSYVVTCRDGGRKVINFRSVKLPDQHHLVLFEDITETRNLEEHLNRVQKMEAIGTLAGGIAHDFNNILMSIQGHCTLMLTGPAASQAHMEHVRAIESYAKKATDLTRQLTEFARGGKHEPKPTNLNLLVAESAELFGRTRKEIRIKMNFEPNLWAVEIDRSQMEQVLMNLYVNAWQAMPKGGDLTLSARNVTLKKEFVRPYDLPAGRYAEIQVADTGEGMDEKTMNRIFDPFFTTKESSRGTGLGLSSTYGIIKNHRGIISVSSSKGQGACFSIYLPATRKKVAVQAETEVEMATGCGNILVVDDETMVTDVLEPMLTMLGYTVYLCWCGSDAVDLFKKKKDTIDMVILDMVMPDMGGDEVYECLKEIKPDVKVLLSSGYTLEGRAAEIMARGCTDFIQKPFNINELSDRVKKIIEA